MKPQICMDLYDLLISLSHTGREVASQQQGLTGTDSISCPNLLAEDIQVVRCFAECGTAHTAAWQGMPQAGISLSDTARCLNHIMLNGTQQTGLAAAVIFSYLLKTPSCPVLSFLDTVAASSLLKLVQSQTTIQAAVKGKKRENIRADDMEVDGNDEVTQSTCSAASSAGLAAQECATIITNLTDLFQHFGIRDQPDMIRTTIETLTQVTRLCFEENVVQACFKTLMALLHTRHGSVRELSAVVLRQLTANILGLADSTGAAATKAVPTTAYPKHIAAVRSQALQFVQDVARHSSESWEAVGALARHVVLKAPDKADYRAIATEAAVNLMTQLPAMNQHQFVLFAARLARTPKVCQRLLAVELAPVLLQTFQDPFAPSPAMGLATPAAQQVFKGSTSESAAGSPASDADAATAMDCDSPGPGPRTAQPAETAECGPSATWGQVCIAMLIQRASDKAAAVRGKAVGNLASIIELWCGQKEGPLAASLGQFRQALSLGYAVRMQGGVPGRTPAIITPPFISPAGDDDPGATPMNDSTPQCHTHPISTGPHLQRGGLHRQLLENAHQGAARANALQLDVEVLVHMARRRCMDEKAAVRKAGLQLLEALLMMRAQGAGGSDPELPTEQDIRALEAATADALVTVRRTGLLAVSRLLRELPDQTAVTELWVRAALPMARDVEASLQEQLLEQFHELVLARAVAAGSTGRSQTALAAAAAAADLLRPILAVLPASGAAGSTCLGRACGALHAKKRLKGKAAATGLQNIIQQLTAQGNGTGGKEVAGAWMLMVEVSVQDPAAPSWEFLQEAWKNLQQQSISEAADTGGDSTLLLRVIANSAARFPVAQAAHLATDLLKAVEQFALSPTAAAAHIAALAQLTASRSDAATDKAALASHSSSDIAVWGSTVLQAAEEELGRFVEQVGDASVEGTCDGPHGMTGTEWRVATALFTAGEVALLRQGKASGRLVVLVQALTTPTLVAAAAAGSFVQGTDVPAVIQAHAWVALGKLCLTDETLAKKCVPLFVQQLRAAKAPAVRNNIMVALADLCVQYTALVDTHLPRLAACLTDPNELVRRQALALLANLLQKDYVKWRGPLFHRFLLALVDDSPSVRALAEYLLTDTLASKAPLLAYNHFVEALFVLNDCRAGLHGGGSVALISDTDSAQAGESNLAQLQGSSPSARAKREAIYRALLQRMAPEHKFATAAKLCGEVLGGVADGLLPLEQCEEVLGDALRCLASKDIKVSTSRQAVGDEDDPAAVVGAAKGRLVSAMMKKHLVEGVVPVLIELKRSLEGLRHWLLGDLLTCIRALLKDHKNEIEDILVGDKQLAKEILYDMKQAELAKERDPAAALPAPAQPSARQGPAAPGQPHAETSAAPPSPMPGLSSRGAKSHKHSQSRVRHSAGHSAAGTSAHSPVAAQVLAASQGMRRKSRLQHVTAADDAASPSGAPQQATPSSATASKAAGNLQRQGHTPQGTGHPCALEDGGQTPRTVGGSAYMTPPTGSAQRPAPRLRPSSPAVGGTPVSVPRLRQQTARKSLLNPHGNEGGAAEAKHGHDQEGDENIDIGNGPANIQLVSPCQLGANQARWNVPPGTATAGARNDAHRTTMTTQVTAGADPAVQTRRSTRTQPARKRKG